MRFLRGFFKFCCWNPRKYIDRKTKKYVGGYSFIWYRSWLLVLFPILFWIVFLPKREKNNVNSKQNVFIFDDNYYKRIKILARTFLLLCIIICSLWVIISFIYSIFIYKPQGEVTVIDQVFSAIICIIFAVNIPFIPLTIIFNTKLRNLNRLKLQNNEKTLTSHKYNTSNINNSVNKPYMDQRLSYPEYFSDEEDDDEEEEEKKEEEELEEIRREALDEGWDEEEMDLEEFEDYLR
ncbi:MAG: hypothetical protein MJ217_01770 [Bacilli bacterium]|nr:hypothetical protein [Bacilli bacterium]